MLTVISYNICANFFSDRDSNTNHHWSTRSQYVKSNLVKYNAHIICLQELSPLQAQEIKDYFVDYQCYFLIHSPTSDVPVPDIITNPNEYIGKNVGACITCILVHKDIKVNQCSKFWLNETPNETPIAQDRELTDKGFGSMNTFRATLWVEVIFQNEPVYIFTSHYPLSGGNKTRHQCALLETKMIKEIARDNMWINTGDKNLMPTKEDEPHRAPILAHNVLCKNAYYVSSNHIGPKTTWIGFNYDNAKNPIVDGKLVNDDALDYIISNKEPIKSVHDVCAFGNLEDRLFTSDHCLLCYTF